jgi:flagellin-like protein
MRKSFRRNRKAVSPVIATIIIVAIAIVMAIAVAYWMLGLGSTFTRYEKLEFTTAYAEVESDGDFIVHLKVKNTGSAAATIDIDSILYNGKPADAYTSKPDATFTPETLNPGETSDGEISLPSNGEWTSGMTVEIMIHTTAGKDYPKVVVLP